MMSPQTSTAAMHRMASGPGMQRMAQRSPRNHTRPCVEPTTRSNKYPAGQLRSNCLFDGQVDSRFLEDGVTPVGRSGRMNGWCSTQTL
jgi:hypothetical protein